MSDKRITLDRYELRSELGRGFHGRVFLAWDPKLQREVALKLLPQTEADAGNEQRFMTEARAVAKLAHPNVIPLFDAGLQGRYAYLVFEYVRGISLRSLLEQRGALPEPEALSLFLQVLDGIAAAHDAGIAHLDLSPSNLLLDDDGRMRVMDFGLSRPDVVTKAANPHEIQYGSPRYMSPEHFVGPRLDRATDVFALGLILFEMLSGRPAALEPELSRVQARLAAARFDWTVLESRKVSSAVVQVLRDALARDPGRRLQTAREFRQALKEAQSSQAEPAAHDLAVRFLLRRLQRQPEFPAFSNSIAEINRLTAEGSTSGIDELVEVIRRDFSLTNRLMKVSNSAFFDRGGGGVATLEQAIGLIGTRMVRLLSSGLIVFDTLGKGREELEQSLVISFVAGLVARRLMRSRDRALAEEAFVSGLFNRLGRNLVACYLTEEHTEILKLQGEGRGAAEAERQVLGTDCGRLGAAVAKTWKFPPVMVASMLPLSPGPIESATENVQLLQLQLHAHLANELCEIAWFDIADASAACGRLATRYHAALGYAKETLIDALIAGLGDFTGVAQSLEVSAAQSNYCRHCAEYLERLRQSAAPERAD